MTSSAEALLYWCDRTPVVPVLDFEVTINSTLVTPSGTNLTLYTSDYQNWSTSAGQMNDSHLVYMSRVIDEVLAGPILATICVFGIIGNLLNILILSRKAMTKGMERMEKSAHMGLTALALSDMLFCLTALPSCFQTNIFLTRNRFKLLYHIYHEGLINTFVLSSTWLTVTMAVSRYVAICHPLKARQIIGMSFAKGTVVIVFVFSILFNVPRFLEAAPRSINCFEGGAMYYWDPGLLTPLVYKRWKLCYQWLYFILGILLPLLLLIFCNIRLIRALRQSTRLCAIGSKHNRSPGKSHNQTRRITLTLVIIVITYLVLVSPAEINAFLLKMALENAGGVTWYNILVSVLNTLQAINFAFNFLLYCAINTYFRRTIRDFFCAVTGVEKKHSRRKNSLTGSMKLSPMYTRQTTYMSETSTMM